MEKVSRALITESLRPTESSKAPPAVSNRAVLFWARMGELYGNTWTQGHGEIPTPLWCQMLDSLSDDQVKRGLQACAKDTDSFPPSLGQFLAWTKESSHPPMVVPMLPKPRNVELARTTLGALKKRLRGG